MIWITLLTLIYLQLKYKTHFYVCPNKYKIVFVSRIFSIAGSCFSVNVYDITVTVILEHNNMITVKVKTSCLSMFLLHYDI